MDDFSSDNESPKTESQFSRWSGIVLMVAILMVAGILSAMTAMRFAIRGREVAVPSLVGKTEEEAQRLLTDTGLIMKVSGSRFSTDIPEGQILIQFPRPKLVLRRAGVCGFFCRWESGNYPCPT